MKVNWNSHKSIGTNHNVAKSSCGLFLGTRPFNWTWSQMNFYEHCPLMKYSISKACMTPQIHSSDFSSFSCWSTTETNRNSYLFSKLCLKFGVCNWLLMFAIDFWRFQLSLLKAHDSLQQSQLEKFYKKILENFSNWLSVSNWL